MQLAVVVVIVAYCRGSIRSCVVSFIFFFISIPKCMKFLFVIVTIVPESTPVKLQRVL